MLSNTKKTIRYYGKFVKGSPMTRIDVFHSVSVTLFISILAASSLPGAERSDLPNIVIIMADDMGYGDVRTLNPVSGIPTPNLDALARQGMTFVDGHSPSAVCTPTRYALLTGRYCWRSKLKSGVLGGYSPPLLEDGRRTIADMLQGQGYRTAAVGKWHLGMEMPRLDGKEGGLTKWDGDPGIDFAGRIVNSPIHHGFDEYFGVSASLDMAPYVYIRNDRFTMLPKFQQKAVKFPHFVRSGPRAKDFVIADVLDRLTKEAVGFIDRSAKQAPPFFLYMPLTGPHKPTQPHERFRGKTKLNEYGDFVTQVDWTVGQISAALDRNQVADNTLFVFTSDNGSYMYRFDDPTKKDHVQDETIQGYRAEHHRANGPFRGTKADIYEAGHHVPLFVRWPGTVAAGSSCNHAVCLTDLFATCAEVAGADLADNVAEDSFSLLPFLGGLDGKRGAAVIHHSINGTFAIRDGSWKLIASSGSGGRERPRGKPFDGSFQLYNLSDDAAEENNRAEELPAKAKELAVELRRLIKSGRSR
jgi:arylsulfatase A-like enzyme